MREQAKSLKQERDSLSKQLEVKESFSPEAKVQPQQRKVCGGGFLPQSFSRESNPSEWLTVGEAYQVAVARGFDKSDVTFRRCLKNALAADSMPEELSRIGLIGDFNSRRLANPSNNSSRWLRCGDGNGYPH